MVSNLYLTASNQLPSPTTTTPSDVTKFRQVGGTVAIKSTFDLLGRKGTATNVGEMGGDCSTQRELRK